MYEEFSSEVRSSSDGENVTIQVVKDKDDTVNKEYKLKIVTVNSEDEPFPNTEIRVTGQNSTVIRQGTDYTGTYVVGSLTANNTTAEVYHIDQSTPSGYYPVETIDLTINKTLDGDEYMASSSVNDIEGVTTEVDEDNQEIIVKIVRRLRPNPPRPQYFSLKIEYKINGEYIDGVKLNVNAMGESADFTTEDGIITLGSVPAAIGSNYVFKIKEVSLPSGYDPVMGEGVEGIVTVTANQAGETLNVDYSATTNDVEGLSVNVNGNMVTITISGVKEEDKYDLALKKFISKIDNETIENRAPVVKKTANGYSYEMNTETEKASNGQKVTYTLRTFNESERNGEGKRVNEFIPKGLVFLPEDSVNVENGWKMYKKVDGSLVEVTDPDEAELIATDKLIGTAIPGFGGDVAEGEVADLSYLDVQAVFVVDDSVFTEKENRIIENTAQIEPNDNDDNGDNDTTTEKIYVKYFDLKIEKKIKEVKVTTDGNTTTKTKVGDELVKVDIPRSKINGAVLDVTYTLTVSNVGEIPGYATDIEDKIPKGMKLVDENGWEGAEEYANYRELSETIINPGESKTFDIKFTWTLSEQDVGLKVNSAQIVTYYNLSGAPDITPDNIAEEPLLIAVKTGKKAIITVEVIAALALATGLVIYIKKKNS